ncbi:M20 family peptidase [Parvularcula sp. IMCC14364]|uniref:M20 family peptidase n=1 Tax=Parvularcula sp. IMCC14364 TaxID=3067902 RepID=UPI002741294A|nr:M20 family peptidase [Parvularcula sp. IMCC14364]
MRKVLTGAVIMLAVMALIIGIMLVRTFTYGDGVSADSEQVNLPDVPAINVEQAAQHLAEAIQFKTITLMAGDPRPGQEGPWLALHEWLTETYPADHNVMTREIVPGGLTLLYTWQGSNPDLDPLLLMAHQDVVPVNIGTEKDWTGQPFSGEIIDGYIYGRGAIDDKGSLVALMEAADGLTRDGFTPQRTIHFLFGHDEEVSGSGAEAAISLLQARGVKPVMALDEGALVIDKSPLTGKPMAFIGIAEKGYLSVEIAALGRGGHSSTPPRDSAAVRLARAVVALDENQLPADFSKPPVSDLFQTAAPDLPFQTRMALANLWLFGGQVEKQMAVSPSANAMIRTTTAPTMLTGSAKENVLAQRATAVVNFRIHPNDTAESIVAHIKDVTQDIPGIEVRPLTDGIDSTSAPAVSPTDNRAYAVLSSVATNVSGGAPVAPFLVLGATDARYATAITDNVYRFAPMVMKAEDLAGFHGTNERISIENMGQLVRGYSQIILAMDAP